jgi:predicted DNA-binding protein (MmcQ/YjbR family)
MSEENGSPPDVRFALAKLRRACGILPEAIETTTFGHPTFQAGKRRTFVVLDDHEQPEMLCLVFKAALKDQACLVDGKRFFRSKFGAKHGWTAMQVDRLTDWQHVKQLVVASYRLVALKRMVAAFDRSDRPPRRPRRSKSGGLRPRPG